MRAATLVSAFSIAAKWMMGAHAQAVEEGIAPEESAPPGCESTVDGNFTLGIMSLPPSKRMWKRETAQEAAGAALACTLEDGILRDSNGRIGSIVANYQFQFDGPPQAGAIYTGGFSVCANTSLALGGSTIWYHCMSGEFGNLYDRSIGEQCSQVKIVAQMIDEPLPTTTTTSTSAETSAGSAIPTDAPVSSINDTSTQSITLTPSSVESPTATGTTLPTEKAVDEPSDTNDLAPEETVALAPESGAVTQSVPRKTTFGAVLGVLGAALMF